MVMELSDTRRVFVLLSRVSPGALWTRSASLSLKLNALFVKPCSALRSTSSPPPFADRTGCPRLESRGSGRKLPKRKRIKARRGRLFHPHPTLVPTPRPIVVVYPAVAILSPISAPTITPTIRPGELVGWRSAHGTPCADLLAQLRSLSH